MKCIQRVHIIYIQYIILSQAGCFIEDFDCLPENILISQLKHHGITDNSVVILLDYLSNR